MPVIAGGHRCFHSPQFPIAALQNPRPKKKIGDRMHDDAGSQTSRENKKQGDHQSPDDRGEPLDMHGAEDQ